MIIDRYEAIALVVFAAGVIGFVFYVIPSITTAIALIDRVFGGGLN